MIPVSNLLKNWSYIQAQQKIGPTFKLKNLSELEAKSKSGPSFMLKKWSRFQAHSKVVQVSSSISKK